jgi:hypothetical protein
LIKLHRKKPHSKTYDKPNIRLINLQANLNGIEKQMLFSNFEIMHETQNKFPQIKSGTFVGNHSGNVYCTNVS